MAERDRCRYRFGRGAARVIFGEGQPDEARPPIHRQTEAEIRADEKRYDADAARLDAEDAAAWKLRAG